MLSPFSSPVLCKVGGWDGSKSASEVHDGGVGLQCLVIVLAVEATVAACGEEPPTKLIHGFHSTYIAQQVLEQPSIPEDPYLQGMRWWHSPVTPPSYPNSTPPLAAIMQANTTYVVVFASTSITPAAARSMSAALRILEDGTYSSPVLEVMLGLPIFADCLSIATTEQQDCGVCRDGDK